MLSRMCVSGRCAQGRDDIMSIEGQTRSLPNQETCRLVMSSDRWDRERQPLPRCRRPGCAHHLSPTRSISIATVQVQTDMSPQRGEMTSTMSAPAVSTQTVHKCACDDFVCACSNGLECFRLTRRGWRQVGKGRRVNVDIQISTTLHLVSSTSI